jgi:hypothetical protein
LASLTVLKRIAPEFADRADLNEWIFQASSQLSPDAWGNLYALGACYLAAHLLTISVGEQFSSGGAGPVTSVKEGDLSLSFGSLSAAGSDQYYLTTKYGAEYLRMRRTLVLTPRVY